MRLISCMVRPSKVEDVRRALTHAGVSAVKVAEVHDHTPQKFETTVWLGHEYTLGFAAKMQVDVVVHDDDVDEVVTAIIKSARTGHAGDGHVIVVPIDHRYNIRNGERDVS